METQMATGTGSRLPNVEHLKTETETFQQLLPTLTAEEGKFAVIFGTELVGIFDSYNDALKAGYDKAKLEPFLVQQISSAGVIAHFTRDIACHT